MRVSFRATHTAVFPGGESWDDLWNGNVKLDDRTRVRVRAEGEPVVEASAKRLFPVAGRANDDDAFLGRLGEDVKTR